jgi:uncharacterized protein (DUF1499 family)
MKSVYTIFPLAIFFCACGGVQTHSHGVAEGRLAPCPDSPNCVCSQDDGPRFIQPIAYSGGKAGALKKLRQTILSMDRTQIIEDKDNFLRVEFRSRIFRFVDDVVFYLPDEPVIHVRSASRAGYWDLGANRKRVERIRSLFNPS